MASIESNVRLTINLYQKQCLVPIVTWNKKHSSKQVLQIKNKLNKRLFAFAILRRLVSCFFSDRVKKHFGLYEYPLDLHNGEDQVNTVYKK